MQKNIANLNLLWLEVVKTTELFGWLKYIEIQRQLI